MVEARTCDLTDAPQCDFMLSSESEKIPRSWTTADGDMVSGPILNLVEGALTRTSRSRPSHMP